MFEGTTTERQTHTLHIYTHVLMRDEKEERKMQARSNKQQDKATQHTQVTYPKKNELPQVGLEPTTHVHIHRAEAALTTD